MIVFVFLLVKPEDKPETTEKDLSKRYCWVSDRLLLKNNLQVKI